MFANKVVLLVAVWLQSHISSMNCAVDISTKCDICKDMADNFKKVCIEISCK